MSEIIVKLLLAHFLGDFVLQPGSWVQDKMTQKIKSSKFYLHLLVHAALLWTVFAFDLHYWLGITFIIISHGAIDMLKIYATARKPKGWYFFVDQILHLAAIAGVVQFYNGPLPYSALPWADLQKWALTLTTLTVVLSVFIKQLIAPWRPTENQSEELKNAGTYIGMLERLFIFGFIWANYWEGIGFLLTAKSVLRFGDVSRSKDRNRTEYILIGTLLSYGLAIAVSLAFLML